MFRNRKTQRLSNRLGVATVEMAMVVPVIFLMIFGSIEFARMMMVRQGLTNAARAGCRNACLITTQSDSSSESAVRQSLRGVVANAAETDVIRVSFDPPITATVPTGTPIHTTVEMDCSDVSWLPPFFTAGAQLRGTSTMKRE